MRKQTPKPCPFCKSADVFVERFELMTETEVEQARADLRTYMSGSSMSPRMPLNHDYELSVRDEIRTKLEQTR